MVAFDIVIIIADMLLYILFLDSTLKVRKKINPFIFYFCFLAFELIMYINTVIWGDEISGIRIISNILISTIGSFLLCFLYDASTRYRIISTIIFQTFALIGELAASLIPGLSSGTDSSGETAAHIYISAGSKLVIMILILITRNFFTYKKEYKRIRFNYLSFMTPVLSFVILLSMPRIYADYDIHHIEILISIISLTLINIFNYYLINESVSYHLELERNAALNTQIKYQSTNYQNLQQAYKNTRKVIHDTKNSYFVIREMVHSKQYDKLDGFIADELNTLDTAYYSVNTGNIVIDSLLNHLINISASRNINIKKDININPNKINISDYDLSIILGNLIDNSLNAVELIPSDFNKEIVVDIFTNKNNFVIHIANTIYSNSKDNHKNDIDHGYGIDNIESIVNKHTGIYVHELKDNNMYDSIVLIPIIGK